MRRFRRLQPILLGLAFWPIFLQAPLGAQQASVPFVGCKSDGQVGPAPAPTAPDRIVRMDAELAGRLAYYKAQAGTGVLGPRGWNCFGTYGSSGTTLYVTPGPINNETLSASIAGPAIQLSQRSGETSGRFQVAEVIARVFPGHQEFTKRVLDEQIVPSLKFADRPYPADQLFYKSDRIVEYETAPDSEGLGTTSRLQRNNQPIRGVAILKGTVPDLWLASLRLPDRIDDLVPLIIRQLEQEP